MKLKTFKCWRTPVNSSGIDHANIMWNEVQYISCGFDRHVDVLSFFSLHRSKSAGFQYLRLSHGASATKCTNATKDHSKTWGQKRLCKTCKRNKDKAFAKSTLWRADGLNLSPRLRASIWSLSWKCRRRDLVERRQHGLLFCALYHIVR